MSKRKRRELPGVPTLEKGWTGGRGRNGGPRGQVHDGDLHKLVTHGRTGRQRSREGGERRREKKIVGRSDNTEHA